MKPRPRERTEVLQAELGSLPSNLRARRAPPKRSNACLENAAHKTASGETHYMQQIVIWSLAAYQDYAFNRVMLELSQLEDPFWFERLIEGRARFCTKTTVDHT